MAKSKKVKKKSKGKSKSKSKSRRRKTPKVKPGRMDLKRKEKERAEKEKAEREAREAIERQRQYEREMSQRAIHLLESAASISFYDKVCFAYFQQQKRLREWQVFTACSNLPDFKLNEMNSYMTNWVVDLSSPTIENVFRLSPEILQLIDELKEFLLLPLETVSVDTIREIGLLYHEFKERQQKFLDKSTYEIIQDLSEYYDPEEGIFDLVQAIEPITLSMYANIFAQPDLMGHNYEKLRFKFKVPDGLVEQRGVYRLLKTEYDHYSDNSNSFFAPGTNNALKRSIEEWVMKKNEGKKKEFHLLTPPETEDEDSKKVGAKKDKKKKRKKKGKSKKKRKSKKNNKPGSALGSKKSATTDTDDIDLDEEYKKLALELDNVEKKAKKKNAKFKKGKRGKQKPPQSLTETSDTDAEEDEEETEDDHEEEGEGSEGNTTEQFTEDEFKPTKKETKEERRARRRKEIEDAENDDDFDDLDISKPSSGKKMDHNDSDSDEEKKKKFKSQMSVKKGELNPVGKSDAEESGEENKDSGGENTQKRTRKSRPKPKKKKNSKNPKRKNRKKRSKRRKRSKKSKKNGKSGKGGKSKSKSRSKSKKGKGSSKSKSVVDGIDSDTVDTSKTQSPNSTRSRSQKGRGRPSSKKRGKRSKSPSNRSKSSTKSKSKSRSKSRKRGTSGKSKSSSGRSKSKSPAARGRTKSKEKSKSKSKSRSKSKRRGRTKSKTKSKSKSRSRSKSKKRKTKKKSKSKERTKTEAELAKERERAEKAKFIPPLALHELNLRNYTILGGVYHFNWLEIPPQPKERGDWILHLIENEQNLREITFVADFIPPTPPDMQEAKKTPEEMEREAKKQEEELQKLVALDVKLPPDIQLLDEEVEQKSDLDLKKQEELLSAYEAEKERRLEQLILVEIDVPRTALWFEPPIPVRWDEQHRIWSTDGFYDIRFNEDQLHLVFRTTKFGIIGLGHNRFSNLPYQSFELRPGGQNKCTFSLMAAMAAIEFTVSNDLVCVSSLQNVSNSDVVEAAIINKYMNPRSLMKALRYHGLDVFPELDSYAYVDGVLLKHIETEEHMYQCMAILSPAYNFHWSRWNLLAGRERMVFQMRERLGTTTPGNYQMVLNTPVKASLIACTEVSPNFSEEPVENSEYHADLLHLAMAYSTDEAKTVIKKSNPHFVETVRILITAVRPVSFS